MNVLQFRNHISQVALVGHQLQQCKRYGVLAGNQFLFKAVDTIGNYSKYLLA